MKFNNAFLLTGAAAIIWGVTAPIMKLTLTQVPVFSLAFIRMLLASLILAMLILLPRRSSTMSTSAMSAPTVSSGQSNRSVPNGSDESQRGKNLKIRKEDRLNLFWAAITGVTLNLTFFFFGLKLTEAINASFLVASVPIFTILAAHFYLREKLTLRLVLASVVAFAGVSIIIGKPATSANTARVFGNILLLLASLSWVAHEMLAKKLLKKYSPGTIAFYTMGVGAVTLFPFFLAELVRNPAWINGVSYTGIAGILYGIFFSSLIAYWAWQKGFSLMRAGEASFFFYLDPVSGAVLSILLLGEKITFNLIIGGMFIAIGVLLAEYHRRAHPLHR